MEHRVERVSGLLIRELSDIIKNEVKDPRISEFVTITDVKVSKDLQSAKVYYSVVGDKKKEEATGKALNDAANFIRVKLKPRLTMRYIPNLKFFLDESFDNAEKIYGILKKIEDEKKGRDGETPGAGDGDEKKESDK